MKFRLERTSDFISTDFSNLPGPWCHRTGVDYETREVGKWSEDMELLGYEDEKVAYATIELHTLEELVEFLEDIGQCVMGNKSIEIYDDWRE